MKISKLRLLSMLVISMAAFSSCDTDGPDSLSSSTTTTTKETNPTFDKYLSTSDKASFSIWGRFKTGGDSESNLSATVHRQAYLKNDFYTKEDRTQQSGKYASI